MVEEGGYELADLSACQKRAIIAGDVNEDLVEHEANFESNYPSFYGPPLLFRPRGVSQSASGVESNAGSIYAVIIFLNFYLFN